MPTASYNLPLDGSRRHSDSGIGNKKDIRSVKKKIGHDYYDGDLATTNKFNVLRDELRLSSSSSDEEHKQYVKDQNSIYM